MRVKVLCVAGARPNFMKIAPILRAFAANPLFEARLVHTGQHYDDALSKVFFDELKIPRADVNLGIGSGSHAQQTAEIMQSFEPVLAAEQPHVLLVVGDVNSTIACTLVAAKFRLNEAFQTVDGPRDRPLLVHVEAGLRSFDREMPEEINRLLTDSICELLYVSDPAGIDNLKNEGVADKRVAFVGNVMIDTLLAAKERAMQSDILEQNALEEKGFGLVTMHRPSNVDDPETLKDLLGTLDKISHELPLVFPLHPRTKARMEAANITLDESRWKVIPPIGYLDFMKLIATAKVVLTDSGGIQEETTVLGVPCVTMRENTERPVTVDEGTNFLAGIGREKILEGFKYAMTTPPEGRIPRFWDGKSAERIADHIAEQFPKQ
jgi:UDP-N-acetylglucosamine 2-epimerase (non-hydrolysing)